MERKLYRSNRNKALAGVCGGIGEHLNIDPVVIRLLWIFFTLLGGAGFLLYIAAIFIIPPDPGIMNGQVYAGSDGLKLFIIIVIVMLGIGVLVKFVFGLAFFMYGMDWVADIW